MHGNVWEWCQDLYGQYKPEATVDPQGLQGQTYVLRGGSWIIIPWYCRSALRIRVNPVDRNYYFGFRVVVEVPKTP